MSSIHPSELKGIPHEDCLTLFIKWAFNDGDDQRQHPNLMKIGEEIVKKMQRGSFGCENIGEPTFFLSKTDDSYRISIRE